MLYPAAQVSKVLAYIHTYKLYLLRGALVPHPRYLPPLVRTASLQNLASSSKAQTFPTDQAPPTFQPTPPPSLSTSHSLMLSVRPATSSHIVPTSCVLVCGSQSVLSVWVLGVFSPSPTNYPPILFLFEGLRSPSKSSQTAFVLTIGTRSFDTSFSDRQYWKLHKYWYSASRSLGSPTSNQARHLIQLLHHTGLCSPATR